MRLNEAANDLEECSYYALSYAWGDPQPVHNIRCNGHKMTIARNLYSLLNRLRLKNEEMMLWVDAICINQSDDIAALQERGQQVAMMHVVYASAIAVVIDLGERDIDTNYLLYNLNFFPSTASGRVGKAIHRMVRCS